MVHSLKAVVFRVGSLNLALRIESVYKVLNHTLVYSSGVNPVGITHLSEREVVVIDLQRRLFNSSGIQHASQPGFLIVAENPAGELYGIPVESTPTLMEIPLPAIRVLPESYRRADTLGIASHVAVVPQPESALAIFLLDVNQLLTTSNK